mgnify:CR=1 FL=1
MIEILEFIFQDFCHFIGTVILFICFPMPFRNNDIHINKKGKDD